MPRWCNSTWPCVQASVAARSKCGRVPMLIHQVQHFLPRSATTVQNATRAVPPGASRTQRVRLKMGRAPCHRAGLDDAPARLAGERAFLPRPMNAARSVSEGPVPAVSPSTTTKCAAQTVASCGERRRRAATSAPISGKYSVCTKSFENAGCASSATRGARTSSAYDVTSMVRARSPVFAKVTRRTSASHSSTRRHRAS